MRALRFDKNILWLLLLGIMVYIPFNGSVHLFDWDEINFAESAREMIETGNYLDVQINYETFWEKPPLFFWMQTVSMKIFGVNEFAARFPNAICGIFTLLVLYLIGRSLKNKLAGLVWALVYVASLLPFFYFKSGIIDPWFNLFIFLGIWFALQYTQGYHPLNTIRAVLSALFIGLAMLTKGPVALLIFALVSIIFIVIKKFHVVVRWYDVIVFIIVFSIVGGFWFILQIFNGNSEIIQQFIEYQIRLFKTQDAGHGGFPFYHVVVLFVGVFPASIFALREYYFRDRGNIQLKHMHTWMITLLLVVLVLFSIVNTKIVHYSSLCYFPITYLAAQRVYRLYQGINKIKIFETILISFFSVSLALLVFAFTSLKFLKPSLINSGVIKDEFVLANLQAPVSWTGMEFVSGLILIITLVFILILFNKHKPKQGLIVFAIGLVCFQLVAMKTLLHRVEEITQKTVISFYKSLPENDVYVETIGFKSYAHLFYFNKPLPKHGTNFSQHQLLWGKIDKPAYFVSKITLKDEILDKHPQLKIIDERNGFVFYLRDIDD
jgi:4-amino-4-deoxy-L-arabinose transferase-like glycosyltransferase